ncbi:hypothetical protein QL285_026768 [Trifolium repens]|nr:hypothetical protein QL285_026768 [Trifolium repens]
MPYMRLNHKCHGKQNINKDGENDDVDDQFEEDNVDDDDKTNLNELDIFLSTRSVKKLQQTIKSTTPDNEALKPGPCACIFKFSPTLTRLGDDELHCTLRTALLLDTVKDAETQKEKYVSI